MISKELISSVLNVNCTECESAVYGGMLGFKTDNRDFNHLINVYELAHKCKEWANKKYKACLISGYCKSFSYKCFTDNPYELQYIKKVETQTADTEPEAIFKACEHILKEIK